jgi:hypothetical protein
MEDKILLYGKWINTGVDYDGSYKKSTIELTKSQLAQQLKPDM